MPTNIKDSGTTTIKGTHFIAITEGVDEIVFMVDTKGAQFAVDFETLSMYVDHRRGTDGAS